MHIGFKHTDREADLHIQGHRLSITLSNHSAIQLEFNNSKTKHSIQMNLTWFVLEFHKTSV